MALETTFKRRFKGRIFLFASSCSSECNQYKVSESVYIKGRQEVDLKTGTTLRLWSPKLRFLIAWLARTHFSCNSDSHARSEWGVRWTRSKWFHTKSGYKILSWWYAMSVSGNPRFKNVISFWGSSKKASGFVLDCLQEGGNSAASITFKSH